MDAILSSLRRGLTRLFLVIFPEPIQVTFFEGPALIKGNVRKAALFNFFHQLLEIRPGLTPEQISAIMSLPRPAVQTVLAAMSRLRIVYSDATRRYFCRGPFQVEVDQLTVEKRGRVLLCYWPEKQTLLPVEPRLRLRDFVHLDIHRLGADLRQVYEELVAQSQKRPLVLSTGEQVRLVSPVGEATTGVGSDAQGANLSQLSRDWSEMAHPAKALRLAEFDDVLVTCYWLDVLALGWLRQRDRVWTPVWRLYSRPLKGPEEKSKGPFAPGPVGEGLTVLEQLAGASLRSLSKFFTADPNCWRELIADNVRSSVDNVTFDLREEREALLRKEGGEASEKSMFTLETNLSPSVRLIVATSAKPAPDTGEKPM